ncbi:NADH-binding protein [Geomonas silvestris]|uniref:NADH-binding protein n=1 Tax=Geomonas silvestris TaxID=2740184 RepID=A0A6V8MEE5_9BACT|nr:NAD(P)H-binding protein [Geomonas silvestris]GFO58360.1 NADH-binding protein [Geomonas silvestris]
MTQRVLVTGASGFIGRRLVGALADAGVPVRCLVRRPVEFPGTVETVIGDLLEPLTLPAALAGVHTVYYLVHSMAGGRAEFVRRDREAAENLRRAAEQAGVRRVIYLGGLGETGAGFSGHLASRLEVAGILQSGGYATTFLRAAIIFGAGGASFEMIRALVQHLPLMITPRWVSTRCQPIAVGDVIRYLVGCLFQEATAGETFDIGGPEILSYREMMERLAALTGRRLTIVPVPVLTPRLSSYWVGLITPVKPAIAIPLIEGLASEVVCRENRIRELIPFPLTPFDEAVVQALQEEKTPGNL